MTDSRHLLIVDTSLEAGELDKLRGVLESTERTVQVVHETEAEFLLSLLSAGIFASVGVVFHGPGVPSWLLDGPMVGAVNRCLAAHGSLDLLGCNVRPEDLALSALYALYPDHPVCASRDITGRDGNWTLELLVQEGGRVSLDHTRSLAQIYFTPAVYDLDVQFGVGSMVGDILEIVVTAVQAEQNRANAAWWVTERARLDAEHAVNVTNHEKIVQEAAVTKKAAEEAAARAAQEAARVAQEAARVAQLAEQQRHREATWAEAARKSEAAMAALTAAAARVIESAQRAEADRVAEANRLVNEDHSRRGKRRPGPR